MKRFYVVVNRALPRGPAGAQIAHAVAAFAHQHGAEPMLDAKVCVFGAEDAVQLENLLADLRSKDVKVTPFNEPDRSNELTAFVAEGGTKSAQALSVLPFL